MHLSDIAKFSITPISVFHRQCNPPCSAAGTPQGMLADRQSTHYHFGRCQVVPTSSRPTLELPYLHMAENIHFISVFSDTDAFVHRILTDFITDEGQDRRGKAGALASQT